MAQLAIRKMSFNTLFGADLKKSVAKGEVKNGDHICKIVGAVNGIREGMGAYGEFTGFAGDFLAVTPDGTEYTSGELFLDGKTTNVVKGRYQQAAQNQGADAVVEIAINVSIEVNDKLPMGYAYVVTPLQLLNASRWGALRAKLLTNDAPAPAADPAPAPAPEKAAK